MATHWTCATPRFHKSELPDLFGSKNETTWHNLYDKAESFLKPIKIADPKNPFDDSDPNKQRNPFSDSIRHYVVLNALQYELPDHQAQQLPLAASKDSPVKTDADDYINWHSPYTIIQPVASLDTKTLPTFTIYTNALCTKLEHQNQHAGFTITSATLKNVRHEAPDVTVNAKCYIIAAGAILGPQVFILSTSLLSLSLIYACFFPQLLAKSGLSPYASDKNGDSFPIPNAVRFAFLFVSLQLLFSDVFILIQGKWITEQTLSFCQIVLRRDIVDSLDPLINPDWKLPPGWGKPGDTWPQWIRDKIIAHRDENPNDPIPIPLKDKEPQVCEAGAIQIC